MSKTKSSRPRPVLRRTDCDGGDDGCDGEDDGSGDGPDGVSYDHDGQSVLV